MKTHCPRSDCVLTQNLSPVRGQIIRKGTFFRKSDSRYITRYFCKNCNHSFSNATLKPNAYQKCRRITPLVFELYNSGISQRRLAKVLHVNPKTIVRRIRYIAAMERDRHEKWLRTNYVDQPLNYIQFDDLETAEHTKCKPLSVALAVDPITRKILKFKVNQMPAKGHLAKVALRKYGYRKDERPKGWDQLMGELTGVLTPEVVIRSDANPHYPKFVFKYFPKATHETSLGGRGSIGGQGELKKLKFDPLFSLNHTCAMLRANLNRLFRRTWCISKNKQGLIDHLSMYVAYHNRELTSG